MHGFRRGRWQRSGDGQSGSQWRWEAPPSDQHFQLMNFKRHYLPRMPLALLSVFRFTDLCLEKLYCAVVLAEMEGSKSVIQLAHLALLSGATGAVCVEFVWKSGELRSAGDAVSADS